MIVFWRAALGVVGIAAVAAYVFQDLFKILLNKISFSQIPPEQTFQFALVFMVLVFVFCLVMALKKPSHHNDGSKFSFTPPQDLPLESAARVLAVKHNADVKFIDFKPEELSAQLNRTEVRGKSLKDALEKLRTLSKTYVRKYEVSGKRNVYTLKMTRDS